MKTIDIKILDTRMKELLPAFATTVAQVWTCVPALMHLFP